MNELTNKNKQEVRGVLPIEIKDIFLKQLELLTELSEENSVEPEQVTKISLAMVEIAKLFIL